MAEEESTYLAPRGVEVIMDEAVVGEVVQIFHDLNIATGADPGEAAVGMDLLVEVINSEMSADIALEELQRELDAEEKMDKEVDDHIVMGDIDALVSSIQSRNAFQDHIDFVNNAEEQDMEQLQNAVEGVSLLPNQDCRTKTSASSSASSSTTTAESSTSAQLPPASASMLNDQQLEQYVQDQKPPNTVRRTRQVINKFEEWVRITYNDSRRTDKIDALTLNNYLSNYLLSARRIDGTDFEPDTLTSIQRAIDRYLKDKRYPFKILVDPEFEPSRTILQSRRKELKSKGKGGRPNKSSAITDEQLEQLWVKEVFGGKTPKTLQDTLYYYCTCAFGFRGCHEGRQLCWGDVVLGQEEDGTTYLELRCERLTKTRQGAEGGHTRAYNPRLYSNPDDTRCPIQLYLRYGERRPASMMAPTSPFFLTPKQDVRPEDETWYKSGAMGINKLANIMPSVAAAAGLDGHITNHSIRRTACQNLVASNVPSTSAIQLTGHKRVDSLSNYAQATKRQQRDMSRIVTGQSSAPSSASNAVSLLNPPLPPPAPTAALGAPPVAINPPPVIPPVAMIPPMPFVQQPLVAPVAVYTPPGPPANRPNIAAVPVPPAQLGMLPAAAVRGQHKRREHKY